MKAIDVVDTIIKCGQIAEQINHQVSDEKLYLLDNISFEGDEVCVEYRSIKDWDSDSYNIFVTIENEDFEMSLDDVKEKYRKRDLLIFQEYQEKKQKEAEEKQRKIDEQEHLTYERLKKKFES